MSTKTSDVVLEARPWPRGYILWPWPSWDLLPWPGRTRSWPWPRELHWHYLASPSK